MRYFTIILFNVLSILITSAQDTILPVFNEEVPEAIDVSPISKCFQVNFNVTPDGVVRKDCPEGSISSYTVSVSNSCARKSCTHRAILYFGDQFLGIKSLKPLTSVVFSGSFDEFDLTGINTPSDIPLIVKIYEDCTIWSFPPVSTTELIETHEYILNVRSSGETYTVAQFLGTEIIEEYCVETEEMADLKLCCNPAVTKKFRLDDVEQSVTSTSYGFNFNLFDIKWKINDHVSLFNFSANYSWTHNHSYSTIEVVRTDFDLNAGMGECVFPGFQLYGRRYLVTTYEVECEYGYDIPLGEAIEIVPVKIEPFECVIPPSDPSSCGNPTIIIDSGNNFGQRTISCSGYINVIPTGEDPEDYSYYWTGPNGYNSTDASIYDVPLGQYNLYVSNSCCEGFDTTIYLCNGLSYGPWSLDSDSGLYCRDVFCTTCDDAVSSARTSDIEVYTECVYPTYGPFSFNEASLMCQREILLGDEVLTIESSIPQIVDSYDDFSEECIRTYYCDGSEYFFIGDTPGFTDWQYDEFFEECYREVICFGNEVPDYEEEVDGSLSWNYDEFWEECEAVVYCDGEETDITISEDPDVEWGFDEFFYKCEATVLCDGDVVDEYETDPELVDFEYDDFFNLCELEVTCDGSVIFNYTTNISGGEIVGQDDEGNDLCEPYCAGEPTGVIVPCADIDGILGKNGGTSTRSIEINDKISISPNPFFSSFIIDHLPTDRILQFRMYEMTSSRIVMDKSMVNKSGKTRIRIDESLPNGIYVVTVAIGTELIFRDKIIKI